MHSAHSLRSLPGSPSWGLELRLVPATRGDSAAANFRTLSTRAHHHHHHHLLLHLLLSHAPKQLLPRAWSSNKAPVRTQFTASPPPILSCSQAVALLPRAPSLSLTPRSLLAKRILSIIPAGSSLSISSSYPHISPWILQFPSQIRLLASLPPTHWPPPSQMRSTASTTGEPLLACRILARSRACQERSRAMFP